MVEYLDEKFGDRTSPTFFFKDIETTTLDEERASSNLLHFDTVTGSSSFHCMVFTPGKETFKASRLICICDQCKVSIGSCDRFKEYSVNVGYLNKAHLRSNEAEFVPSNDDNDNVNSFLTPESIVAIAADKKSIDTIWFIKVIEAECVNDDEDEHDAYGHSVPKGVAFMKGNFLEKIQDSTNGQIFKLPKKITFFYKESVLYPYVNFKETKKGLVLSSSEYTDIIHYVENNNYCHI